MLNLNFQMQEQNVILKRSSEYAILNVWSFAEILNI